MFEDSEALRSVASTYDKEPDMDFEEYARSTGVDVDGLRAEKNKEQVQSAFVGTASPQPEAGGPQPGDIQNPQAGKEEKMGDPGKGALYGLVDAAELAVNGGIVLADWMENAAASVGLGSGDLISDASKVDWSSKLGKPTDGFETRAMRAITKYAAPVVGSMGGGLLAGVGAGRAALAGIGAGAASDFLLIDPKQERLADMMINELPELKNYPVAFNAISRLATKPDDTEIESRFKNMLEGMAIGVPIAAGAYGVMKWSASAKRAADIATSPPKPPKTTAVPAKILSEAEVAAAEAKMGANVPAPAVSVTAEGAVRANTNSDEAMGFITDYVRANPSADLDYVPGTFDTFTGEGSEILANQDKLTELLSRRAGDRPFTPGEVAAGKQLVGEMNSSYIAAATKAAESKNPEDLAAFVRMHDNRNFIVGLTQGAASTAGASLAAEKIAAEGMGMTVSQFIKSQSEADRAAMLADILKFSGGQAKVENLAAAIATLAAQDAKGAISATNRAVVAAKGNWQRASQLIEATAINGMISSPKTTVANHLNNAQAALKQTFDNYFAVIPGVFQGRGTENFQAANDYIMGQVFSMGELFSNIGKAIKTGEGAPKSVLNASNMAKYPKMVSAESLGVPTERGMGYKAIGVMADTYGLAVGIPTRLNATADAAWGTAAYRGRLNQLAMAEVRDAGLKGPEANAFLKSYLKDPPVQAHEQAVTWAEQMTFSQSLDPESWAGTANRALDKTPMGRVAFPFFKTTANVVSYTLNNSPFAVLLPGSKTRSALAAGGKEADMALAKITTGGLAIGAAAVYSSAGLYSGPDTRNPKMIQVLSEQGQGWKPNSVLSDGEWKDISRLDYTNSIMRLGHLVASTRNYVDAAEYEQLATAAASAAADFLTPEMLVDSYALFFDAFGEAIGGEDRGALERFGTDVVARATPYSALSKDIKNINDPYKVDTKVAKEREGNFKKFGAFIDKLQAKYSSINPMFSKDLPIQRNVFGEALLAPFGSLEGGIADGLETVFVPWASQKAKGTELVETLSRMTGFYEQMGPTNKDLPSLSVTMPPRSFSHAGVTVDLDPYEYSKFVLYSAGLDPETEQPLIPGGSLREVMSGELEGMKDQLKQGLEPVVYKKLVGVFSKTMLKYRQMGQQLMLSDPAIMEKWKKANDARLKVQDFSKVLGE